MGCEGVESNIGGLGPHGLGSVLPPQIIVAVEVGKATGRCNSHHDLAVIATEEFAQLDVGERKHVVFAVDVDDYFSEPVAGRWRVGVIPKVVPIRVELLPIGRFDRMDNDT